MPHEEIESAIDRELLAQLEGLQMAGSPDILMEIIGSFLETTPVRVRAILGFIQGGDVPGAAREAHALGSSAQTLGAVGLGKICRQIEGRGAKPDLASLAALGTALEESYLASCTELAGIEKGRRK